MKKLLVLAVAAAGVFSLSAIDFRVECENFTLVDVAETNDAKVAGMGSASEGNLIYFGKAKTGATAVAKFDIPESQKYYVWVRDYSMSGKSRKGTISFTANGKSKKIGTFGDEATPDGKGGIWMWNRAPFPVTIEAGVTEFKIVGRPYCRFDEIIFTTDPELKPEGKMPDVPELEPAN